MSARYFEGPVYSREGIVAALRDFELEHGAVPTRKAWDEAVPFPSSRTIARHLGSWNAALEAAGMTPNRETPTRCPTCECIDAPGHTGACICSCGEMPRLPCRTVR